MKNYNIDIDRGIHRIKVTIQQWDYVGHIFQGTIGTCKGKSILDFDFESEDGENENDCNLRYEEETGWFFAELKNESGNTLFVEGDAEDFNQMIVAMEIMDFVEKKQ